MAKVLSLWVKAGSEFPVIDPADGKRIDVVTPVKVVITPWVRKQYEAKVLVDSDDEDQVEANATAVAAYDKEAFAAAVTKSAEEAAAAAAIEAEKQAAVEAAKAKKAEETAAAKKALAESGVTTGGGVKLTPAKS